MTPTPPPATGIRVAVPDDLPAIVEIYNQAVSMRTATADLTPISVGDRTSWLEEHHPYTHPVFVAEDGGTVTGWCSISPYRPGRMALRHTAEISYYVHEDFRRRGIGSRLIARAVDRCPSLEIRTLFAILLDINTASVGILEKFGFEKWGHLPGVADFGEVECGHLYYGRRVIP
ncbi:MAG TPA: N-acetyltransferase family protein [Deltaproteobacteria bacterium]|nr:N-acetyltransferase family protein [Deltaproteobacteria bacterium]HXK48295.1 N-acetyltransferase family protein [Deltaproteobacteria bacterium]